MGRSIILLVLLLAILVSLSPQVRTNMGETWKTIQPAVVASMDSLYAVVRAFIAGNDSGNRTNDSPVTPGENFNVIIT
jgi:hypothetical protein